MARLKRAGFHKLIALACVVASFAGVVTLSQPQQKAPAGVVRVETRLVLVDVVVTDKKGVSVTGLKREDFVVKEEGKAQDIAIFTGADPAPAAPQPEPLPPHVHTNRPTPGSPEGPLTIILLDSLNTPRSDQAFIRQDLLAFLDMVLKSGQRTAILGLTDQLHVFQDFTVERDRLRAALQKFTPQSSALYGVREQATGKEAHYEIEKMQDLIKAGLPREFVNALQRFNEQAMAAADKKRAQLTLAALRVVGGAVAGYPGRKNLIWVSGAFPTVFRTSYRVNSATSAEDEMHRTVQLLNDARVAIYPVDPRGLVDATQSESYLETVKRQGDAGQNRPSTLVNQPSGNNTPSQSVLHPAYYLVTSQEAMNEMAQETGGLAFYNRNDAGRAVALAAADGAAYYTLGYYPQNGTADGRFRRIEVKVQGKDLVARYRQGYFARPAGIEVSRSEPPAAPTPELVAALYDPLPATELTFRAFVPPPPSGSRDAQIGVRIDDGTFAPGTRRDFKRLDLLLVVGVMTPGGKIGKAVMKRVQWPETASGYADALKKGIEFKASVELDPGEYILRLLLRDNQTGLLGRVDAPLTVGTARPVQ